MLGVPTYWRTLERDTVNDKTLHEQEERRLFYVGMTREKQTLSLSRAVYRRAYGEERLRASLPSRFRAKS